MNDLIDYISSKKALLSEIREWLKLLISLATPVIIAGGAWITNNYLKNRDEKRLTQERKIATEKEQQTIIKDYLEEITSLSLNDQWPTESENLNEEDNNPDRQDDRQLLENNIQKITNPDSYSLMEFLKTLNKIKVVSIANAFTLTVLNELNGDKKEYIIKFLNDSGFLKILLLESADLSKSKLINIDFTKRYLGGVNFDNANLSYSKFTGSYLIGVKFVGANLHIASLNKAYLFTGQLNKAQLYKTDLSQTTFNMTDLSEAKLSEAKFGFTAFIEANLSQADFSTGIIEKTDNSEEVKFKAATIYSTVFKKNNLSQANFAKAILRQVYFEKANLSGANFNEAVLINVNFEEGNISGANFSKAVLVNVDFNNVEGFNENQFVFQTPTLEKFKNTINSLLNRNYPETQPCLWNVQFPEESRIEQNREKVLEILQKRLKIPREQVGALIL